MVSNHLNLDRKTDMVSESPRASNYFKELPLLLKMQEKYIRRFGEIGLEEEFKMRADEKIEKIKNQILPRRSMSSTWDDKLRSKKSLGHKEAQLLKANSKKWANAPGKRSQRYISMEDRNNFSASNLNLGEAVEQKIHEIEESHHEKMVESQMTMIDTASGEMGGLDKVEKEEQEETQIEHGGSRTRAGTDSEEFSKKLNRTQTKVIFQEFKELKRKRNSQRANQSGMIGLGKGGKFLESVTEFSMPTIQPKIAQKAKNNFSNFSVQQGSRKTGYRSGEHSLEAGKAGKHWNSFGRRKSKNRRVLSKADIFIGEPFYEARSGSKDFSNNAISSQRSGFTSKNVTRQKFGKKGKFLSNRETLLAGHRKNFKSLGWTNESTGKLPEFSQTGMRTKRRKSKKMNFRKKSNPVISRFERQGSLYESMDGTENENSEEHTSSTMRMANSKFYDLMEKIPNLSQQRQWQLMDLSIPFQARQPPTSSKANTASYWRGKPKSELTIRQIRKIERRNKALIAIFKKRKERITGWDGKKKKGLVDLNKYDKYKKKIGFWASVRGGEMSQGAGDSGGGGTTEKSSSENFYDINSDDEGKGKKRLSHSDVDELRSRLQSERTGEFSEMPLSRKATLKVKKGKKKVRKRAQENSYPRMK